MESRDLQINMNKQNEGDNQQCRQLTSVQHANEM